LRPTKPRQTNRGTPTDELGQTAKSQAAQTQAAQTRRVGRVSCCAALENQKTLENSSQASPRGLKLPRYAQRQFELAIRGGDPRAEQLPELAVADAGVRVLELWRVEQVVDLGAQLCRHPLADRNVLYE
jgi:hypothetical protein